MVYGIYNFLKVNHYKIFFIIFIKNKIIFAYKTKLSKENLLQQDIEKQGLLNLPGDFENKKILLESLSNTIKDGAKTFLYQEYIYLTIFIFAFSAIIFFFAEHKKGTFYTTGTFIIGAYTSIICGYIGMMIATSANSKTAYFAQ